MFSYLIKEALQARADKARREASEIRARLNDPNKFFSEHHIMALHRSAVQNELIAEWLEAKAEER